jgi:hypothetical protein
MRNGGLEAAIGIEPMNKGFAETSGAFAQLPTCSLVPILIGDCAFSSLRLRLEFGSVLMSSDPTVTQESVA